MSPKRCTVIWTITKNRFQFKKLPLVRETNILHMGISGIQIDLNDDYYTS